MNRIKEDRREEVEAELNKSVPISGSEAEVTNFLLIFEQNHPEYFIGVDYHDGKDLRAMTNLEQHEEANRRAAEAEAAKKK